MSVVAGSAGWLCVLGAAGCAWWAVAPVRVHDPAATGPPTGWRTGAGGVAPGLGDRAQGVDGVDGVEGSWLRRYRWLWCASAAVAGAVLVGGPLWPVGAVGAAAACWVVIARSEPAAVRERREEVQRSLPDVVALVGAALRSGAAPGPALDLVADALPGPATQAARSVAGHLALGADPADAWRRLALEPGLASWGRAMARAHETGAPVLETVERLADQLAAQARAEVEDRARTVGVRAALPLGLCLLPAFLLVGIVPLVAGLLGSLW